MTAEFPFKNVSLLRSLMSAYRWVADGEVGYLVDVGDSQQLASRVQQILDQSTVWDRFAVAGVERPISLAAIYARCL
jgi:hypothetical protein